MKKAIVLAGTPPHATLIKKLKGMGYYTLLVDYYPHPYAADFADKHIQESTLDKEKVLQIAKDENADIVITTCMDHANVTACYVSERLHLPHPYSYQTALDVTDKVRMKQKMKASGIPTSDFYVVRSLEEAFPLRIDFPIIIKPTDRNGSKGVHRADTDEEARQYIVKALETSFAKAAIIEGFNVGDEIQVDCFATDNGAEVLMTRLKQKINSGDNNSVQQSLGSIFPAPLSVENQKQVKDISVSIAKTFQLNNVPFFYQANVTGDGIKVIEFAARVAGGLSYYILKKITGYDPVEAALQSWIGNKVEIKKNVQNKFFSTNLIYMRPGVFDHIEGFERLKQEGIISDGLCFLHKGDFVDDDMQSGNRVGAFIVEADTMKELYDKMKIAIGIVDIIDSRGQSAINQNYYSNNFNCIKTKITDLFGK